MRAEETPARGNSIRTGSTPQPRRSAATNVVSALAANSPTGPVNNNSQAVNSPIIHEVHQMITAEERDYENDCAMKWEQMKDTFQDTSTSLAANIVAKLSTADYARSCVQR